MKHLCDDTSGARGHISGTQRRNWHGRCLNWGSWRSKRKGRLVVLASRTKSLRLNPVPGIRALCWNKQRETHVQIMCLLFIAVLFSKLLNSPWASLRITHKLIFSINVSSLLLSSPAPSCSLANRISLQAYLPFPKYSCFAKYLFLQMLLCPSSPLGWLYSYKITSLSLWNILLAPFWVSTTTFFEQPYIISLTACCKLNWNYLH